MKKLLVFQPVDVHESRVPTKFLYENKKKKKKSSREKKKIPEVLVEIHLRGEF